MENFIFERSWKQYISVLEKIGANVTAGEFTITATLGEAFATYDLDEQEWYIECGYSSDGEMIFNALSAEGAKFDVCTERYFCQN